ncbi:SAP domain-containing ribonucleoprotein [Gastrophryne carolinensis]
MAETVDIHKLKLAELKQECLARGLDVKGNKSDLINRLQVYLEEHAVEEEPNEEDVLGDDTEEEEPKPVDEPVIKEQPDAKTEEIEAEKKVVKITSEVPQADRLQKRAERFNVPANLDSKKAARAMRFGVSSPEQKVKTADGKSTVNVEKLKERAQRFGVGASLVMKKSDDEKLKKRKERFGIVTSSASLGDDIEEKKRKRSERFGLV